jgi:hypothetical protein
MVFELIGYNRKGHCRDTRHHRNDEAAEMGKRSNKKADARNPTQNIKECLHASFHDNSRRTQ